LAAPIATMISQKPLVSYHPVRQDDRSLGNNTEVISSSAINQPKLQKIAYCPQLDK